MLPSEIRDSSAGRNRRYPISCEQKFELSIYSLPKAMTVKCEANLFCLISCFVIQVACLNQGAAKQALQLSNLNELILGTQRTREKKANKCVIETKNTHTHKIRNPKLWSSGHPTWNFVWFQNHYPLIREVPQFGCRSNSSHLACRNSPSGTSFPSQPLSGWVPKVLHLDAKNNASQGCSREQYPI